MNDLLLDTHALLWWWTDHPSLSPVAREAISDTETQVFASAVSAWEMATKTRLGRLGEFSGLVPHFGASVTADGFLHLPVVHEQALRAGSFAATHKDPFDRMLAAQAEIESLTLVTRDRAFEEFPVTTLW